jgi:phenylacetate-CoA ligase
MTNLPVNSRADLERHQLGRLNLLLSQVLESNTFYRDKFKHSSLPVESLNHWGTFPTTSKSELSQKANSQGLAPHHTFPSDRYTRFHRTSGSTGKPLIILDTPDDWIAWIDAWQSVLDAAAIEAQDVVFMAFSFGPFIGFWTAQDACLKRGCRVVPGGGLSTVARIDLIRDSGATVLFSTPSYALHLAETAFNKGIDPRELGIRKIVVAGEPGGSVPTIRERLQERFDTEVTDHAGATEVGPWGFGTSDGSSLAINEAHFIAEFEPINKEDGTKYLATEWTGNLNADHTIPLCELVLTNLNRLGAPALRYRTGDVVRPALSKVSVGNGNASNTVLPNAILLGGILGRSDQMMTIRGVNVFPSAIDAIVRSFVEIGEYRLIATKNGTRDEVTIQIEDTLHEPKRLIDKLDTNLGLRIEVTEVPQGTFESFMDKSKRFIDRR